MLKIDKSKVVIPDVLLKKGVSETQKLIAQLGTTMLDFDNSIYGHTSVKRLLKDLQYQKCCYCEQRRPFARECDVEHFRPKAGYKAHIDSALIQPGYYWLAYDFSNLFYACKTCNQEFKGSLFPIVDESKRAKSHLDDYRHEEPLLVHPEFDDPAAHLTFEKFEIKGKTHKGEVTIRCLGLDSPILTSEREKHYRLAETLAEFAQKGHELAINRMKELSQPNALFSFMIRSNFPDLV